MYLFCSPRCISSEFHVLQSGLQSGSKFFFLQNEKKKLQFVSESKVIHIYLQKLKPLVILLDRKRNHYNNHSHASDDKYFSNYIPKTSNTFFFKLCIDILYIVQINTSSVMYYLFNNSFNTKSQTKLINRVLL